jgi:hypothetical protein
VEQDEPSDPGEISLLGAKPVATSPHERADFIYRLGLPGTRWFDSLAMADQWKNLKDHDPLIQPRLDETMFALITNFRLLSLGVQSPLIDKR